MLGLAKRNHGVENDYRGRREGEREGEDGERVDDGRERRLKCLLDAFQPCTLSSNSYCSNHKSYRQEVQGH